MIDSSIAFLINGLGAVPTPRNTAHFQSQYRQSRPSRLFSAKNPKKNPRRKIRGIFKMPPSWLASLPRFSKSQGRGF